MLEDDRDTPNIHSLSVIVVVRSIVTGQPVIVGKVQFDSDVVVRYNIANQSVVARRVQTDAEVRIKPAVRVALLPISLLLFDVTLIPASLS